MERVRFLRSQIIREKFFFAGSRIKEITLSPEAYIANYLGHELIYNTHVYIMYTLVYTCPVDSDVLFVEV